MPRYQTKPRVVDAFQWRPTLEAEDYPEWAREAIVSGQITFLNMDNQYAVAKVALTGGKVASAYIDDWIARDKWGAIYTVQAKTFEKNYELAPNDT